MSGLTFPPTFILKTRFDTKEEQDELHRIEESLQPNLRFNVKEAEIVIGKVNGRERAKHALKILGLPTEEFLGVFEQGEIDYGSKRRKVDSGIEEVATWGSGSEVESGHESGNDEVLNQSRKRKRARSSSESQHDRSDSPTTPSIVPDGTVVVLKLSWYYDSIKAGSLLPMVAPYLVYHGQITSDIPSSQTSQPLNAPSSILARARADTPPPPTRRFGNQRSHQSSPSSTKSKFSQRLVHEDTIDHEEAEVMPAIPEHLKTRWSCQRPTPMHCPNDDFVEQLKIIRHARELESNEQHHQFSTKAYSAGIAVIQSYPYRIKSVAEVRRLPGVGEKIAKDWQEWHETGEIEEVKEIQADERLNALNVFWKIHQVADATARKFYDYYKWKDLEDLVEFGWEKLNRDQQIGLKYYDELNMPIPRAEVKDTEKIILDFANGIHPGFHICTVGGYRRGKEYSGDMDFILSHPNEAATQDFIGHLLNVLNEHNWVKHELTVSFRNSDRGQETLAWRGLDGNPQQKRHIGFDTLDHAFVVWKNPNTPPEGMEYPHRRVDIIISPWKTAGCAVLGWSGGKLFEQHLRSYVKHEKGWKFDSSGVRHRGTGTWIDLESREEDRERKEEVTLVEKEKRVFEGLGLNYLLPTERCTH